MFEANSWYNEVIILGIIPAIVEINVASVSGIILAFLDLEYLIDVPLVPIFFRIPSLFIFIGLGVWRINKKSLNAREVVAFFLIVIAVSFVSTLLFPFYLAYPFGIGLLFLIVWLIHRKSVNKIVDLDTEVDGTDNLSRSSQ